MQTSASSRSGGKVVVIPKTDIPACRAACRRAREILGFCKNSAQRPLQGPRTHAMGGIDVEDARMQRVWKPRVRAELEPLQRGLQNWKPQ